jgi:hypothetical protein
MPRHLFTEYDCKKFVMNVVYAHWDFLKINERCNSILTSTPAAKKKNSGRLKKLSSQGNDLPFSSKRVL